MFNHQWQKSSHSGSSNACVEVRVVDGWVELRESDEGDLVLCATRANFTNLLDFVKAGELDHHI
ncbi:protein of unknown function [Streptomyces sp. TLI_053]|uniref:DUF397 domain-containing protein n=1 Tax=Streptomyces sp. TLI_053 TaxID=1855352 RepID=UPI00087ABB0A|nr:DUF397 domain-containing protein [Streptomyces sp. TLI_053]SDT61405.1 protein of unknown function [Streptomyces sp. TLI_053]